MSHNFHAVVAVTVVGLCIFGAVNQLLVIRAVVMNCEIKKNSSFRLIISLAACDFLNLLLHSFGGVEAALGRLGTTNRIL